MSDRDSQGATPNAPWLVNFGCGTDPLMKAFRNAFGDL
jgi:hypothetical protein